MNVTENQHIDAVRARVRDRYPEVDPSMVNDLITAVHHRFDGCRVRDFVPLLVERAAKRVLDDTPPIAAPPIAAPPVDVSVHSGRSAHTTAR
ncbi:three-helix bundle dimerization domain-containing protein [Rhodococcus koreensis]